MKSKKKYVYAVQTNSIGAGRQILVDYLPTLEIATEYYDSLILRHGCCDIIKHLVEVK